MAVLLPWIKQQFLDLNGKPLDSGKIYIYLAGTTIPKAAYSDRDGLTPLANPVILDANGECEIWLRAGNYKFIITDKDDVVIKTIDNVAPADGGGGGMTDDDYNFDGFSTRFNESFVSTGLQDTLDKIIKLGYLAPAVTFTASGSTTVREKGEVVTASTLSAVIVKKSNNITDVVFSQDSIPIHTVPTPNPAGGTESYSWTGSFDDDTTFSVAVTDEANVVGGPTTITRFVDFDFVYPYYFGSGPQSLSAALIGMMPKLIIKSNSNLGQSIPVDASEVPYLAYPASYGALTSILDVNGFETLPDWTLRTENITGLDGASISYRIYEFNNPLVNGSYYFTFKR